tara:strand:+ start:2704 stop:3612 length:909 start_codon:yes stop_codon:yes gene_type:complete
MAGCNCDAGLSNTGQPSCVPIQSVTSSLIMVPLKDSLGVKNGINLSTALPVWEDLINEADESKRWFPIPQFENVELPKADSQFEEANSGRMAFLRQGKRSFAGELWGEDSTPTLLGKLQAGRCVAFGIYIVDVNGNLVGSKSDGYLYPIPVDEQSWNPVFNFATDSTVQKIVLGFDFNRLFDESTMYMITAEESAVDFNTLAGLIDVNLTEVSQITTTTFVFTAKFDYGTALNPIIFSGALAVNFELYNVSVGASVLIDAINEGPDGTYTLLQGVNPLIPGDTYRVSVNKTGFIGNTTFLAA